MEAHSHDDWMKCVGLKKLVHLGQLIDGQARRTSTLRYWKASLAPYPTLSPQHLRVLVYDQLLTRHVDAPWHRASLIALAGGDGEAVGVVGRHFRDDDVR
jgi:hypothetical protein